MSFRFPTLTAQQALGLITARLATTFAKGGDAAHTPDVLVTHAQSVRRFFEDDHWQDGAGWVGPKPSLAKAGASDALAMTLYASRFVFENMIKDVTTRHRDGIIGTEPRWGFTPARAMKAEDEPTKEETAAMDTIEAALTEWWNKRSVFELLQRATVEMLLTRRAVLRLYVPSARLVDLAPDPASPAPADGAAPRAPRRGVVAADLAEALDHIFVELVLSENGVLYTDADSMEQIGVVVYHAQGDEPGKLGPKIIETTYLAGAPTDPAAERQTVIRILREAEGTAAAEETALDLGGRLTHYMMEREPLITPAILTLQKALNFILSMIPRNAETSGFTERTLLDAQQPFSLEDDGAGGKKLVANAGYIAGGGVTNYVASALYEGENGQTIKGTPDIRYKEPSPMTPTIEGIDTTEAKILLQAKQGHILGTDQALSGISRQQARADYKTSLGDSKAVIDPAGRWLLESALAMALAFATDTAGIEGDAYRANFETIPNTGPLDPAEVANLITAADKGKISDERVMEALGVEDTDMELARLNAQPGRRIALRLQKAQTLKAFTDAGISLSLAAELSGFDPDEVTQIEEDEAQNPTPVPVPGVIGSIPPDPNAPPPPAPAPPANAPAPAPAAAA